MNKRVPDVDAEAAAAAFSALSDDDRIDILLALWRSESPSFAELQRGTDIEDSGRFNYHLDKLVGEFVEKTDDGYRLNSVGSKAVDLLLDARFGPSPPSIDEPTGADCPACGEPLHAKYEDGDMRLTCVDCGALVHYGFLPPRGRTTRDVDDALDAYSRQVWRDVTLAQRGVCPHCSGRMVTEIDDDPEWATTVAASSQCRDCGSPLSSPLGLRLLADPDVVAFLNDHGYAIDDRRFWEFEFIFDPEAVTVVSESPPRYRLSIAADDRLLEVTVDNTASVVETASRRSR